MTGEMNRLRRYKRWTKHAFKRILRDAQNKSIYPNGISNKSSQYQSYIQWKLKHLNYMQNVLSHKKFRILKLQKLIATEKETVKLANTFLRNNGSNCNKDALVFVGDTQFSPNSPIRGYVRTKIRHFIKTLRKFADVVPVNEFRTTKLCSNCHSVAFIQR